MLYYIKNNTNCVYAAVWRLAEYVSKIYIITNLCTSIFVVRVYMIAATEELHECPPPRYDNIIYVIFNPRGTEEAVIRFESRKQRFDTSYN